jgi:hypothetical protein
MGAVTKIFIPQANWSHALYENQSAAAIEGQVLRVGSLPKDLNFRRIYFFQGWTSATSLSLTGDIVGRVAGQVVLSIPFFITQAAGAALRFSFGNNAATAVTVGGPNCLTLVMPTSATGIVVPPLEISAALDELFVNNRQVGGTGTALHGFLGVLSFLTAN